MGKSGRTRPASTPSRTAGTSMRTTATRRLLNWDAGWRPRIGSSAPPLPRPVPSPQPRILGSIRRCGARSSAGPVSLSVIGVRRRSARPFLVAGWHRVARSGGMQDDVPGWVVVMRWLRAVPARLAAEGAVQRPGKAGASAERAEAGGASEPGKLADPAGERDAVILREGIAVRNRPGVLVPGF